MVKEGYKLTEVGVIPEDWSICLLKNAVVFLDEYRKPIKASDRNKIKGKYPYYGASGIIDYVNEYIFDDELILLGEDGDNILSRSLPLAFKVKGKIWVNNHAHVLKPNKEFDIDFLTSYLESLDYSFLNTGTAQPKLNKESCNNIRVVKPPKPEQKAIAEALSDVDGLIASLETIIKKKEHIKTATMQQLLTGKKRLDGFSGEWVERKLGEVAEFFKGKGLPKSSLIDTGLYKCIHYGELFTTYKENIAKIYSSTNCNQDVMLSKANDILMPTSDVTPNGLSTASCINIDGVILGGDILIIRPISNILNGVFFSYYVRVNKEKVMKLVSGTTVYHLYGSDMANLEFKIPNIEEQQAIAKILSDMDKEIEALKTKLEKTKAIKRGMMQELLTGRIRLVKKDSHDT